MPDSFLSAVKPHYEPAPGTICLGGILYRGTIVKEVGLNIPLRSLNRHGLIAGATGTGKTKTIQMLAEQMASHGIPTLLMDMKGDLSGLAMPGDSDPNLLARQNALGLKYQPQGYGVELLAMGEQPGVKIRATLIEFGPLLFAKMLDLNDTQTSMISILFQYATDHHLLLLDLTDIKQLIRYAQEDGKQAIEANYGGLASHSLKSIFRRIIALESQGGNQLFGEPSFDVNDLLCIDNQGRGIASILQLINLQNKPKLFSTFMLGLLYSIFSKFPEIGDTDKPKLLIFIDEAHLIFRNASKALLEQLENMVKLIRSKGVGLIFCTQSPDDLPPSILSQLGLKIQHALRAFTAKDRKAIKLVAENFPITPFYDITNLLTSLGTGKALLTALDAHGQPTPIVATMIRTPQSRMAPLTPTEINQLVSQSNLAKNYKQRFDHVSAIEKLKSQQAQKKLPPKRKQTHSKSKEESAIESLTKNTLFRQIIRTIFREMTRALISLLRRKR